MNFNFFDWIREGVKRSVLLGVSDAATQLGTPPGDDEVKNNLLSFFKTDTDKKSSQRRIASGGNGGSRKLGRSMKDIQASAETT